LTTVERNHPLAPPPGQLVSSPRHGALGGRGIVVIIESRDQDDHVVEGLVLTRVRGGFLVAVHGRVDAFLPASQAYLRPVETLDALDLVGQRLRFQIVKLKKGGAMVLSRRVLLEKEQESGR
jgi:ribosomal protein S1